MRKRLLLPPVIAVSVNFILFFIKLYIGLRTNCLCIYTDSVNNLMDVLSALLAVFGLYLMKKPVTEKLPFGSGRAEYITGFLMAVFMTGAGILFAYNSIERFFAPTPVWFFVKYAVIIGGSCVVKLIMGTVFFFLGKRDRSPVTRALMMDSFTDFFITAIALVSFTLSNSAGVIIDAYLGLLISIVIAVLGVRMVIGALSNLLGVQDARLISRIEQEIKNIDSSIVIVKNTVHNYGVEKNISALVLSGDRQKQREIKKALWKKLNIESVIEWEDQNEQRKNN